MNPVLLAAILNFIVEFGFSTARAFFKQPIASIDDAIAALDRAQSKALEDYIAEDKAARDKLAGLGSGQIGSGPV